MIKKKYRALRFIAFICQVLAWVTLVLGILGAIGAVGAGLMGYIYVPAMDNNPALGGANPMAIVSVVAGIASAVGIVVFVIVNFVVLLASAEYLHVLIDTEQNTRITAEYLRQLLQTQLPVQTVTPVVAAPVVPPAHEVYPAEPTVTTPSAPLPKSE